MTLRHILPIMIASLFALSACETVEGVGKDVSNAGDAIADAAS